MPRPTRRSSAPLLLAALALLPACSIYIGDGDAVTEERAIGPFTRVAVTSTVDVEITVDAERGEGLTLTCDGNLIDDVDTRVVGDTLRIDSDNGLLRPRAGCFAEVRARRLEAVEVTGSGDLFVLGAAPDLAKLSTSGSGDVFAEAIAAPVVDAASSGSGDMILRGEAVDVSLASSGSGEITAADLEAEAVHAESTGSGDISLSAAVLVFARASGSGDILVFGDPESRDVESSGSGDVLFR